MKRQTRRGLIEDTLDDLIGKFLYYDRKGDSELPLGAIEDAVQKNEITPEHLIERFASHIRDHDWKATR